MLEQKWRWVLGMLYVLAVALIWVVASFVVQSVVDSGVSPFLITYICNSLFLVYIPIIEIGRLCKSRLPSWFLQHTDEENGKKESTQLETSEKEGLLADGLVGDNVPLDQRSNERVEKAGVSQSEGGIDQGTNQDQRKMEIVLTGYEKLDPVQKNEETRGEEEMLREWTRREVAWVSLLVCPFWFLAQFTFNLSLKFTTVTSNTILSSASSLFTFLMSLKFLEEKFTWLKLSSVLCCMAGTIIVSLTDSTSTDEIARSPVWGDILCLVSGLSYAAYTTLIRKLLPDEAKGEGRASTALFFGYLGLFNALLLLPVALILHFTGVEPFHKLSLTQFGLIIGKGIFDNVLSDLLWAKAVLLMTTTAATAGLTIQVPIAAVVDSLKGERPHALDIVGGFFVLIGFFGINQPVTGCCGSSIEEDPALDECHQHKFACKIDNSVENTQSGS